MTTTTKKMPVGYKDKDGKIKIAVSLDKGLFDDVVRNAKRHNMSFSESISDILMCGLLCLREAEEL